MLVMEGGFSECVLLNYRTPARSVASLVPSPLELVTRDGWAFWNIVACRIERMRPAGLPRWCGIDYCHVAYRLFVQAPVASGETIRGLYFIRSDADRKMVEYLGNAATPFRFHHAGITLGITGHKLRLSVFDSFEQQGDAYFIADPGAIPPRPQSSCFSCRKEAADFLRYSPIAFSCDGSDEWLRIDEVNRDETKWKETPLAVREARWFFFESLGQNEAQLELATRVDPIEYSWVLGSRTLAARVAVPQL